VQVEKKMLDWITVSDAFKDLKKEAKSYHFDCHLQDGKLLFTPIAVRKKVFLELDFTWNELGELVAEIIQHRTKKLTNEYNNRHVSRKWIVGFFKKNCASSKRSTKMALALKEKELKREEEIEGRSSPEALEKLQGEFYKQGLAELECIWSDQKDKLVEAEVDLLRRVIRSRKGIDLSPHISIKACSTCGMVNDSCTCGRSWY